MRHVVEHNQQFLQPIPITVITNKKNEILVVKKKYFEGKSPEKNRLLLYFGGHTRSSDIISLENESFLEICRTVLKREIKEEIGISVSLENINPILFYSPTQSKSEKHIAICFKAVLDDNTKLHLDPYEFVPHSASFFKAEDLLKEDLEDWSTLILEYYF